TGPRSSSLTATAASARNGLETTSPTPPSATSSALCTVRRYRLTHGGSTIAPSEGPPRDDVLPAGGRRRRAAAAEVRRAPAEPRDRDACARAGRPQVDPPRRRAPAAHARLGTPCPLPRAEGAETGRGALRHAGPRAHRRAGAAGGTPTARAGRKRQLEPDGDPGGDSHRQARGDRRRADDVAAVLGATDRRGRQARDRQALGLRPSRLC